jgi:hypothetical protein
MVPLMNPYARRVLAAAACADADAPFRICVAGADPFGTLMDRALHAGFQAVVEFVTLVAAVRAAARLLAPAGALTEPERSATQG